MIDKTPYTPGMREVLKLSKAEAARLGHDAVGPEHLLLAIIRKGDGLAFETFENLEIDLAKVKLAIEGMMTSGAEIAPAPFPVSAEAKRALEAAQSTANSMKHGWVGTEHLLLGLLTVEDTLSFKCLGQFGLDFEKAKREVVNVIEGTSKSKEREKAKLAKALRERSLIDEEALRAALQSFEEDPDRARDAKRNLVLPPLGGFPPGGGIMDRDLTRLVRQGLLDPVKAREQEEEELRISQVLGLPAPMANNYFNLGGLAELESDFDRARQCWTRALQLCSLLGASKEADRLKGMLEGLPPPS